MTTIKRKAKLSPKDNMVVITDEENKLDSIGLTDTERKFAVAHFKTGKEKLLLINQYSRHILIALVPVKKEEWQQLEKARHYGYKAAKKFNKLSISSATVTTTFDDAAFALAGAEGMALGNYQFLKYFTAAKSMTNSVQTVHVHANGLTEKAVSQLDTVVEATCHARTLVNEPLSFLNAVQIAEEMKKLGKAAGFKVETFNKTKIEALKMGGLLAVNQGSIDPPTFTIMEYKPKSAKNKKPLVLVGKGIVYDTGGLSLKPTPNSMDIMKCDMGGAAAMIGTMYAVAKSELPVHVIALIPATDNRPGGNAYAPGDVVTMYSGMTVEVMNTDAEGRMVLADALSYAKKYDPELVIDAATLTGAAVRAFGTYACCTMGTATQVDFDQLNGSGFSTHERTVQMPFWDEYGEEIKSPIADIKNLGGSAAGQISAGKFLEHFTDYPWIHVDIAGPAWSDKEDSYRLMGGTGFGVRLFYDFIKNRY
jgi:leucyl aminopeptidase